MAHRGVDGQEHYSHKGIKLSNEIDLLRNYPKANRDLSERVSKKSDEVRNIARKFDFDYFDGERKYGYGGFNYNPKYWSQVVQDMIDHYNLDSQSKVLDVGCAKGFMIYDFIQAMPEIFIEGLDISKYAIDNCKPEVREKIKVGNATKLPYLDDQFDLVISINTIHNLNEIECGMAVREIERVSKKNAFIVVDAYSNEEEKKRMYDWNLTALTIKSKVEWKKFFKENGYTKDYYWFMP